MIGAALLAAAAALLAGDRGRDDPRPNDPAQCPWCGGEPERMAAAGVLSHGGFAFGRTDTAEVDRWLATDDIKWIETAHFEIGFALGPYKVRQEEKNKVRAELERLRAGLLGVKAKANPLDPWLRAHLFAQRCEELWARFLALAGIEGSVFPDGTRAWDMTGKYMGEGPYLGMKGKYEVLIVPSEASSVAYLDHQFGLRHVTTQRWHLPEEGTISVTIHIEQPGGLRMDAALHNHLAFNLAHNLLDGFKHYSYETPVWLHTGLAHFMEREIDPRYNTFDGSEGAVADKTSKTRWESEVRALIASGKAPRLAQLVALKSYGELDLEDNFTSWSMVDFLVRAHPDGFVALLDGLKGLKRADGLSDGGRVQDRQRELFKELLGWSYGEFDQAWRDWAQASYK